MYRLRRWSSRWLYVVALACLLAGVVATERDRHQTDNWENEVDQTGTKQAHKIGQSSLPRKSKDTDRNWDGVEVEDEEEEEEEGYWEEEEEEGGVCKMSGVLHARKQMQQMIEMRKAKIKEVAASFVLSSKNGEKARQDALLFANTLKTLLSQGYQNALKLIDEQVKAEQDNSVYLISKLQEEMQVLEKRDSGLQQLSQDKDYSSYLKSFPGLCLLPETLDWSGVSFHADPMEGTVRKVTSQLLDLLEIIMNSYTTTEWERIQKCAVDVTLDPDTASPSLILSDDKKQVRYSHTHQNVPSSPKRFDPVTIVLGTPAFVLGRFYFEVQVMNKTQWAIGVARESVTRKGRITVSPDNGYWVVGRFAEGYKALTENAVLLSLSEKPQKVGVYVDTEKGMVSFYDVDNKSLIYSYRGFSFPEKLYPFFTPFADEDGLNSAPLVITPISHSM